MEQSGIRTQDPKIQSLTLTTTLLLTVCHLFQKSIRKFQRSKWDCDFFPPLVAGLTLGITATDILFHLGKEEISFPPRSGDRLRRLAGHLLQQRSFYPLYPPNDEINLDMEQLENIAGFDAKPDVMILPSDLLHFFKDIDGTLAMNPQRLTRGEGGGVFARLKVVPSENEADKKRYSVSAEIVRI